MTPAPATGGLDVMLDRPLQQQIATGQPTAVACFGTCSRGSEPVADMVILADGVRRRPAAQGMPRDDHPTYRSGFWETVPLDVAAPRTIELEAEARLSDGTLTRAPIGSIEVVEPPARVELHGTGKRTAPLIAICMATYNSDPELFRAQVESIRAQTDTDWVCVISDDCSEPSRFESIQATVANDDRFIVARSSERLGFYRNFERLLAMAPAEAELIALSDHDDRWHPEKLAALRAAIGDAALAFSDARLTDAQGNVTATTFWEGRRNNYENLASMLMANTVAGASCLLPRHTVERALPFPESAGWDFHDHWLALVALSMGEIAYVDRPLYDYVQHPAAVLGHLAGKPAQDKGDTNEKRSRSSVREVMGRWRSIYFAGYLQRQMYAGVLLSRCDAELSAEKRRALELTRSAVSSPIAFLWLALRPLRSLRGRNETLGFERILVRGILWRRVISLRRSSKRATKLLGDATPTADPKSLGSRQRGWLTGRG